MDTHCQNTVGGVFRFLILLYMWPMLYWRLCVTSQPPDYSSNTPNNCCHIVLSHLQNVVEPTCLHKPSETCRLPGLGLGLARQEPASQNIWWVWNWSKLFLWSKPRLLAGYPVSLLSPSILQSIVVCILQSTLSSTLPIAVNDTDLAHFVVASKYTHRIQDAFNNA